MLRVKIKIINTFFSICSEIKTKMFILIRLFVGYVIIIVHTIEKGNMNYFVRTYL